MAWEVSKTIYIATPFLLALDAHLKPDAKAMPTTDQMTLPKCAFTPTRSNGNRRQIPTLFVIITDNDQDGYFKIKKSLV